jgi:hypothetical protein
METTTKAANTSAVSSWVDANWIMYPNPALAPANSPTIAPITLKVIATLRLQTREHIDRNGEERDDDDERYFGREIVAEPENKDRRQGHFRHRLKQHDERIKRLAEALEPHDHECDADPDDRGERKPKQNLDGC